MKNYWYFYWICNNIDNVPPMKIINVSTDNGKLIKIENSNITDIIHTDKIWKSSGHTDKVLNLWGKKLLIKKNLWNYILDITYVNGGIHIETQLALCTIFVNY